MLLYRFRYASWLLSHLAAQRTGKAIKRVLTEIPHGLNETYVLLLSRIPPSSPDRELLCHCLFWLSFTVRPLRLEELAEAVIMEHTNEKPDSDCRLHSPEILLDISQGLFNLDPRSGLVTLAHSSVKAFLLSDWIKSSSVADYSLDEMSAHSEIMRLCLNYVCYFDPMKEYSTQRYISKTESYPFLEYAANNWTLHTKMLDHHDWTQVKAFLDTHTGIDGGKFGSWMQFMGATIDPRCHPTE